MCEFFKTQNLTDSNYPLNKLNLGVPVVAQWLMNPTRNHEVWGSIPGLPQWVKGSGIAVTCGVGRRWSLDPMLL